MNRIRTIIPMPNDGATIGSALVFVFCCLAGPVFAAGPIYWDWPEDRSFSEMDLEGTALDTGGHLTAGLVATAAGPEGPEVFWRIVPDGRGGYYTGTGHSGEIHHTAAGGKSRLVASLDAAEIFSLHQREDGVLLAGCGPEGQLFRVDRDGQIALAGTVAGGYVWAMAEDPAGDSVWLAGGSPAAIYRYRPGNEDLEEITILPAQNALDLTFTADGRLLVATQGPGLIYSLDPGRRDRPRLLYETAQEEVRQFIRGPQDGLFVLALNTLDSSQGSGPSGGAGAPVPPPAFLALLGENGGETIPRSALYRIHDDGRVAPYWTGEDDLMIASWSAGWGWVAGGPLPEESSRAVLHGLTVPAGSRPMAGWAGGDILDILIRDDEVVVCQAHPGGVTVLGEKGDNPRVAVSPPLDGGQPVRWARLRHQTAGGSKGLQWSVRGGNRSVPDESWSDWTKSWTATDQAIDLDPCRFLQWRVLFPVGSSGAETVTAVSVSAWQDNLPPVITHFSLEHLKDVQMGMMGNHGDSVTRTYRSGLQAEFSQGAPKDHFPGPDRAVVGRGVRVFTWQGKDPNGDGLNYDLEYRRLGETGWRPIVKRTPETLGSWDTAEVPDGRYEVRVVVTDARDNPSHLAARSSRQLGPIAVDNTPPEIAGLAVEAVEKGFKVRFKAKDAGGAVAGASIRLPDGRRERLDPADMVCDSTQEEFAAFIAWPQEGQTGGARPWQVQVEVRDMGGNVAVAEGAVR